MTATKTADTIHHELLIRSIFKKAGFEVMQFADGTLHAGLSNRRVSYNEVAAVIEDMIEDGLVKLYRTNPSKFQIIVIN